MRKNIDKSQQSKKIFDFWECPDFDSKNQMTEISIDFISIGVRLLIVSLLNEIKTVVTEKHLFFNE